MTALVRSDQGVTLIGGGLVSAEDMQTALSLAPLLVAADSGADQALELGHTPEWVIGDLDSISDSGRVRLPRDRVIEIPEQDSTDFTKCVTRIDAPFVLAIGFSGNRLDHTLAVLSGMVQNTVPRVLMLTSDEVVFVAPPMIELPLPVGMRVSLYPMGPANGTSTGLEWPIDGLDFRPNGRVGTSNRAIGPVSLKTDGPMLIMLPREALSVVLGAVAVT